MRKLKYIVLFFISTFLFTACDLMNQIAGDVTSGTYSQAVPLTESEVNNGLKRALTIGAETAVGDLSQPNAFYSDMAYKIFLPKEAQIITDNKDNALLQAAGITKLIEDVEKSMNLAAEKAVIKAKPIFIDAIKNMSIQDAFGILNGGDTAASNYLRVKTYSTLYSQFKPEVSTILGQPLFQGISTNKAWTDLTGAYNGVAAFMPGWNKVNTNLDDYVTNKALAALFEEVKKEELLIRKDPAARVEDILRRVFK